MGDQKDDWIMMIGLAQTLLRLSLASTHKRHSYSMSSYIEICNMGQDYWIRYREKYGLG